jgi:hypothetical protein
MIDKDTGTMIVCLDSEKKPPMRDVATLLLNELNKVPEGDRSSISQVRVLYQRNIGIQTIPVYKGWDGLISMVEDQKTWEG